MMINNQNESPTSGIPILSFFTGGGFLDIGFEESGFSIVWTNEFNTALADMYESAMTVWRHSKDPMLQDARISSRFSITELTPQGVMNDAFGSVRPPLFGVIGGPPCVDFSIGGKNQGANGFNGRLFRIFTDMIKELSPDFFVIENVPGLLKIGKHKSFLKRVIRGLKDKPHRYRVATKIVSALELGVPQNRERLFIIGFTDELVRASLRKHNTPDPVGWFIWPEAIYPDARQLPWPTTSPFGGSPELPQGLPIQLTVNPLLAGPPDPETLPNGEESFKPYSAKFTQIEEGDDSRKSFKRLHRYRYSPTVWYGNNEVHLHPWKPRRLSVREALRIQTVPDTYVLPEEYPLTAKFRLIANGVPCKLAKAVADSVKGFLPSSTSERKLRLL
ncbi:MAG TPA: DNA (cytosine-5-)-methyltransferase [Dehalococcoidia bacterium]|nr:DNA (cytosine-5-)-methyltransferase [Dehalococcoidia bacterium]